jgi:hypothetical protein
MYMQARDLALKSQILIKGKFIPDRPKKATVIKLTSLTTVVTFILALVASNVQTQLRKHH